jgi:hypothetical protein
VELALILKLHFVVVVLVILVMIFITIIIRPFHHTQADYALLSLPLAPQKYVVLLQLLLLHILLLLRPQPGAEPVHEEKPSLPGLLWSRCLPLPLSHQLLLRSAPVSSTQSSDILRLALSSVPVPATTIFIFG